MRQFETTQEEGNDRSYDHHSREPADMSCVALAIMPILSQVTQCHKGFGYMAQIG